MVRKETLENGTEIPVEFENKEQQTTQTPGSEDAKPENREERPEISGGQTATPDRRSEPASELDERYLRLLADFENYRKRVRERETDVAREAEARLIGKLLPVIDDLERMLEHVAEQQGPLAEGARLIYQKLLDVLKAEGLETLDGQDEQFNPEVHHAIQTVAVDDPRLDGKVVAVAKKGYRYKDRLLRPADVLVGKYSEKSSS